MEAVHLKGRFLPALVSGDSVLYPVLIRKRIEGGAGFTWALDAHRMRFRGAAPMNEEILIFGKDT